MGWFTERRQTLYDNAVHFRNAVTFKNRAGTQSLAIAAAGTATLDNTVIGSTTPLAGTFTNITTTTGLIAQSKTTTATALSNTYGVLGAMTASATGILSGNIRGVRGSVTLSGTVTGGAYLAGVQGKLTISGTLNHADARVNGVFGQLDASAGIHTAGYLDAAWFDMGATSPAAGWAAGYSQVVRATNTTASAVNSIYYGYGKATYGLDLSDNGSGWIAAAAGTTAGANPIKIKVNLNGATKYILACDAWS